MSSTTQSSDWSRRSEPPPVTRIGPLAWVAANLFSSWFNGLLTLLALGLLYALARMIVNFIQNSDWQVVAQNLSLFAIGQYPRDQGWRTIASLEIIWALLGISMALWMQRGFLRYLGPGSFLAWMAYRLVARLAGGLPANPAAAIHAGLEIVLGALTIAAWVIAARRWPPVRLRRITLGAWIVSPFVLTLLLSGVGSGAIVIWLSPLTLAVVAEIALVIVYLLLRSRGQASQRWVGWLLGVPIVYFVLFEFVLPPLIQRIGIEWRVPPALLALFPAVRTQLWSGMLLTLVLTVTGILGSFPLGVLLALGRRSDLPIVKTLCTVYIEVFRGVPLVTILFMAQVMLPLFVGSSVDVVMRAMVGTMIFSAAYLAENVRGGLQAIPHGQIEAAQALGLNPALVTGLIVMPQALRIVIPAIVGQFISLFKDTTLVSIITLLDLLGVAKAAIAQNPAFQFHKTEVYLFIGAIYFVVSYVMSSAARRIETATSAMGGTRQL